MLISAKGFHLICYIVLLYWLNCSASASKNKAELIFVNTVWRHGARTPIYSYPNNPNNKNHAWHEQPGQLTQVGMRNHYELGTFLREKYKDFLSSNYLSQEIFVRSTDVDRTLMSAEANMAGLYFPEGYQKWNGSDTNWQPIPIHTIEEDEDKLLRFPPPQCPYYQDVLTLKLQASDTYKKFIADNQDFFDQVAQWSGSGVGNLSNTWHVQDVLYCEKAQGLPKPDWATDEVMDRLNEISGKQMGYLAGNMNEDLRRAISKVGSGNLIKKIIENFTTKTEEKTTRKMIAYSAHDTTVAGLLTAMQSYNDIQPPFASCVVFELLRYNQSSGDPIYYIKTYYRNSTGGTVKLRPFGLSPVSNFNDFIEKSRFYLPGDPEEECRVRKISDYYSSITIAVLCGSLVIQSVILIFYATRKHAPRHCFKPLPEK